MSFFTDILKRIAAEGGRITPEQAAVVRKMNELGDISASSLGMSRRRFLQSQMGMAAFFLAMNSVFGSFFDVHPSEAAEGPAAERNLDDQFIFDVQVHFVRDDFPATEMLLDLRRKARDWNPDLKGKKEAADDLMFDAFYRQLFRESRTKAAVLSNAPADDKKNWFLSNEQALAARRRVNETAGAPVLLAHAVFTPGMPGWLDEIDRMIELKPDGWKGYTLGDPLGESKYYWRLNDRGLVYPALERLEKAGFRNICIHKGLLPAGYRERLTDAQIDCAKVDDVGPAARDFPNLNFIIYHSAIEKNMPDREDLEAFRRTGRISWVSDLAAVPERYGVRNVYGELGSVFATTVIAHPELCAGVLGTLIRGLGPDHVCWGTDSVWYGSPQWQIEAFRRLEIPDEMQRKYGFQPLGPADGPVKRAVFGENSAKLYGTDGGRRLAKTGPTVG